MFVLCMYYVYISYYVCMMYGVCIMYVYNSLVKHTTYKHDKHTYRKMIQIRSVIPNLFVGKNVAVVGSSSALKKEEGGGYIDSFDEVVRFNRAPTEG